ncbi:hypothetical protein JXA88_08190 [Candidatus Fermentibacteria bacterium]|nr:hypothetical protein [Candidatus Fermentibacteria bacterium]
MVKSVIIAGALFGVLSLAFLVTGIAAAKRRHFSGVPANLLLSVLLIGQLALCALIVVGTQGYRALTQEHAAATIETYPIGPGSFRAVFAFPDGSDTSFVIAGDQVYVDAHILKWTSLGTILGLDTAYELDRVSGRYFRLEDEQAKPRTVYSLARKKRVDMFSVRRRYQFLDPLVDAEYGSATFIAADRPARFELRVSLTGLLIRETAVSPRTRIPAT